MSDVRLAHQFAEILNAGDVERFDELLDPGYVNHNRYAAPGPEGVKEVFAGFLAAMPDLVVVTRDALVAGDRVVGRYSYSGTFTAPLLGNAPTGERVVMTSIDIWRVRNGRFVEHWDEINSLELFAQLGAVPLPAGG